MGPTLSVLLQSALSPYEAAEIRTELARRADVRSDGSALGRNDCVLIDGHTFCFLTGEEYPGELDEYREHGLAMAFGWAPREKVCFTANGKLPKDYEILNDLCEYFCGKLDGFIELGPGALEGQGLPLPNWDGTGPRDAVRIERPNGLDGVIVVANYFVANQRWVTTYYVDADFFSAWRREGS